MGFIKKLLKTATHSKELKKEVAKVELVVIKDFCACVNGELNLLSGQKATFLYEIDDWFCVESMLGVQGFVPKSHFRGQVHQGITRLSNYSSCHDIDCNNTQCLENEEKHSDYSYASENASDVFQNRTYRTQRLDSLESVDFDAISDFDNNSYHELYQIEEESLIEKLLSDETQIEYFV